MASSKFNGSASGLGKSEFRNQKPKAEDRGNVVWESKPGFGCWVAIVFFRLLGTCNVMPSWVCSLKLSTCNCWRLEVLAGLPNLWPVWCRPRVPNQSLLPDASKVKVLRNTPSVKWWGLGNCGGHCGALCSRRWLEVVDKMKDAVEGGHHVFEWTLIMKKWGTVMWRRGYLTCPER